LVWLNLKREMEKRATKPLIAQKRGNRVQEMHFIWQPEGITGFELLHLLGQRHYPLGIGLMHGSLRFGNRIDDARENGSLMLLRHVSPHAELMSKHNLVGTQKRFFGVHPKESFGEANAIPYRDSPGTAPSG
jgi:hypothetical protein